jgi:hypothetical protein
MSHKSLTLLRQALEAITLARMVVRVRTCGLLFFALGGCGTSGGFAGTDGGYSDASDAASVSDGGAPSFGASDGSAPVQAPAEVFGHSADALYKLDPMTKKVELVGSFAGCDAAVIDLAMNENADLFVVTPNTLYRVDKSTASCSRIASGSYPNSLSFVPKGTLDPNEEALVGFEFTNYVRIDSRTGQKQIVRTGALKDGLWSSGDIVSVRTPAAPTGGADFRFRSHPGLSSTCASPSSSSLSSSSPASARTAPFGTERDSSKPKDKGRAAPAERSGGG